MVSEEEGTRKQNLRGDHVVEDWRIDGDEQMERSTLQREDDRMGSEGLDRGKKKRFVYESASRSRAYLFFSGRRHTRESKRVEAGAGENLEGR